MIAEPGRSIATAWSTLFTMIQGRRIEQERDGSPAARKFLYYLNDGVYGSFNSIMFDHAKPQPLPVSRLLLEHLVLEKPMGFTGLDTDARLFPATFFGLTCDSMDVIVEDFELEELNVGQWVAFKDMGAYTAAAASTFNGMPKAMVYYARSPEVDHRNHTRHVDEKIPSYA
ncbi:MAG TPA: hypothetical protein VE954_16715 [Oligoflexus sp.]|uniref:hypothetical protein n=1 Tax=Oligoflexus sp. TaxID=1971216 RepID=UPI002D44F523|nr:hypothetical protein [Oligoflexus sp.]HYX34742.1 hypothetical protein [Oligoflexus sp.]